jgi:type II secretory pathway component GspD/PulD (secretin)
MPTLRPFAALALLCWAVPFARSQTPVPVPPAAAPLDAPPADGPSASLSPADEMARLHDLPASRIPLRGATLASAIHLLASSARMSFLAPPDSDFTERVTSDVTMNPYDLLQILGENYNFGIEYEQGIWRFYHINLNELVTKSYTLRFNNLQQVSISSTSINSQLAAFAGGGTGGGGSAGGPGATGATGGGTPSGMSSQNPGADKDPFDSKTGRIIEDIKKILGIPTVGLSTPAFESSPGVPGALAARKGEEAPKIEPIWNPDTSQLFVVATRQQHSLIAAYLRTVDQPQKLVRISVKFVETAHNPQRSVGVDWSNTILGSGGAVSLSGPLPTGVLPTPGPNGLYPISTVSNSLGHIGSFQLPSTLLSAPAFQWTLQAIAQDQNSSIVQDPVIFTANNHEVTFKATTEQPIQEGSTTFGSATAATTSSIAYIEVGTNLTILPSVLPGAGHNKEIVLMNLSINVSTIVGQQLINGNPYPITSTRSYSYSVPIPNGETLAIAGLEERSRQMSDNKVPIFGDIPLLGYAFKSRNDSIVHTTLLAFITPEIVRNSGLGEGSETPQAVLPPLRHRSFAGSPNETLSEVDQSLKWLPEDIAALQSWASASNKELVINRLDRIAVELALMDVRVGELKVTGNRLTQGEESKIQDDRELVSAAHAAVAKMPAD